MFQFDLLPGHRRHVCLYGFWVPRRHLEPSIGVGWVRQSSHCKYVLYTKIIHYIILLKVQLNFLVWLVYWQVFVAGVRPSEIMMSHALVQVVITFIQVIEIMVLAFFIYGVENHGSYLLVLALSMLEGVCGMLYGNSTWSWKYAVLN